MTKKITVRVKPNANENSIALKDGVYHVSISEPADKNKANIELIKFLSKELGCKVRIVSGLRSREKIISRE